MQQLPVNQLELCSLHDLEFYSRKCFTLQNHKYMDMKVEITVCYYVLANHVLNYR